MQPDEANNDFDLILAYSGQGIPGEYQLNAVPIGLVGDNLNPQPVIQNYLFTNNSYEDLTEPNEYLQNLAVQYATSDVENGVAVVVTPATVASVAITLDGVELGNSYTADMDVTQDYNFGINCYNSNGELIPTPAEQEEWSASVTGGTQNANYYATLNDQTGEVFFKEQTPPKVLYVLEVEIQGQRDWLYLSLTHDNYKYCLY